MIYRGEAIVKVNKVRKRKREENMVDFGYLSQWSI